MRHTIPTTSVIVDHRMRKDLGDLSLLCESIKQHGLIQPIVLSPDHKLIAGERRLEAHKTLKIENIDFVYKNEVEPDILAEMEFEENYHRKAFTWQEECLGILNIYRKKRQKGALEGWTWGQRQAADMFGMELGTMNYVLRVAQELEKEQSIPAENRRMWNFSNASEAFRLGLIAAAEDAANLELARRAKLVAQNSASPQQTIDVLNIIAEVRRTEAEPNALAEARTKYESNPLNTTPFEQYWEEKKQRVKESENTVYISNRFHHGDCIGFMNLEENEKRFDHILTDIPYAIDIENLQQESGGKAFDRIKSAHQVHENIQLIRHFFSAAFKCLKDRAFLVTFCDLTGSPDFNIEQADVFTLWELLYKTASLAGFHIQRWPIIWKKVGQAVGNSAASYNSTKDYEAVMVCRKESTVVGNKLNRSIIEGSAIEAIRTTGHPFAKPFEVTRELINMISVPGQTILDPFAGGGSIVLEILKQQRNFIACEKEEHHFNALIENVKREHFRKINPDYIFK